MNSTQWPPLVVPDLIAFAPIVLAAAVTDHTLTDDPLNRPRTVGWIETNLPVGPTTTSERWSLPRRWVRRERP